MIPFVNTAEAESMNQELINSPQLQNSLKE